MTPANDTTSPEVVDRNAAKAPATTSAERISPPSPPISAPGSNNTVASG